MMLAFHFIAFTQQPANLVIVTTDGLRWQEVFSGLDTALANNKMFNEDDSAYLHRAYNHPDATVRRARLMPFFWSVINAGGQVYGNREYGNKVNVANPYWFSYPGYSELLTGYADTLINSNSYPANPHVTILEFLNNQNGYKNKVAVFGAWNAFDRILNEKRSGIPVISAFDSIGGKNPDTVQRLLNRMVQQSYKPWHWDECLDVFTHHAALHELKKNKPRVIYIAYGETDEWAHAGKYRSYIDAAHQVDAWLHEIWNFIQATPGYRDNTLLLVTTDHGRGDFIKSQWTSHGSSIKGSDATWFAIMGPGIKGAGEQKNNVQLYQKQLAQTLASLLGFTFTAAHQVADPVPGLLDTW